MVVLSLHFTYLSFLECKSRTFFVAEYSMPIFLNYSEVVGTKVTVSGTFNRNSGTNVLQKIEKDEDSGDYSSCC